MEFYLWCLVCFLTLFIIKVTCSGTFFKGPHNLHGKVIIVTGANTGIGFQTALEATKHGAHVVLACRDIQKGTHAERSIQNSTKSKHVLFLQLDLASFKSIRNFTKVVKSRFDRVDILINNAGVFWCPFQNTAEGFELNFGVNYLGHFLLTVLLLPLLSNSASKFHTARVVNVVSIMHAFGFINFNDFNYTNRSYSFVKAYSESKLCNVLFTKELSKRLRNRRIKVYSADPGIVATDIGRDSLVMGSFIYKVILQPFVWLLFKSPYSGAQTILYCLSSDKVQNESGMYYAECSKREVWPSGLNDIVSMKLWNKSVELTRLSSKDLELLK